MPERNLILGADIGTTAVKVGVFQLDGTPLAVVSSDYPMHHPRADWVEQDAEDWWNGLLALIDRIAAEVDLRRVASLGVCSQVNTHVPVGADGAALTPAIVWQDQRCAEVAAEIDDAIDDARRRRLWGGAFKVDASFSLSRAVWLARERPAEWARTAWLLLPKDFINLRLTGRAATDVMSPIGVVDAGGRLLPEVFELAPGSAERQPEVLRFTDALGPVSAKQLPDLAGVPVAVGTMDAWGSIYGSGLIEHGAAMEIAGTSEIVGIASRQSIPTPGVISFPPIDGLSVHAGPTQAGGDAVRWWAGVEGMQIEEVIEAASAAPPGAGGIVFHPYLAGERAPLWDSAIRASFHGVGVDHDRRHFARAVLEGVACSARHVLETAETAAGLKVGSVNSSGGGNRSDLWCQIKADYFGRRVDRLRVRDTGVLGAALMGAVAAGSFDDLKTAALRTVEVERSFDPRQPATGACEEMYRIYREVQKTGRETAAALAAWRDAHGADVDSDR